MIKENRRHFVIETLVFGFLFVFHSNIKAIDYKEYCPDSFKQVREDHMFLSKQIAYDADEAVSACKGFNGNLLQLDEKKYVEQKIAYVSEKFRINDTLLIRYNFLDVEKLRVGFQKIISLASFDLQDYNRFRYNASQIYLLKRPIEGYTRKLIFCKTLKNVPDAFDDKWAIRQDDSCPSGWVFDFFAYHGNESSESVWKYHHYTTSLNSSYVSRNLTSRFPVNSDLPAIYSLRYEAFIGARSDYNETEWKWPDGSPVQYIRPSTASSKSKCEHAIMLHSLGDFQSYPVQCTENIPKFFFCEIPMTFKIEEVKCRDTALRVVWDVTDDESYLKYSLLIEVEIRHFIYTARLRSKEVIISDLSPATSYEMKVRFKSELCSAIDLATTLSATTRNGAPNLVSDASVRQSNSTSSDCIIEWSHDLSDENMTKYEITFNDTVILRTILVHFSEPRFSNPVLQYRESFAGFEPNQIFFVKIRPFNCFRSNNATKVNGYCITPTPIVETTDSSTSIITEERSSYYPNSPFEPEEEINIFDEGSSDEPSTDTTFLIFVFGALGLFILVIFCIGGVLCFARHHKRKESAEEISDHKFLKESKINYEEAVAYAEKHLDAIEEVNNISVETALLQHDKELFSVEFNADESKSQSPSLTFSEKSEQNISTHSETLFKSCSASLQETQRTSAKSLNSKKSSLRSLVAKINLSLKSLRSKNTFSTESLNIPDRVPQQNLSFESSSKEKQASSDLLMTETEQVSIKSFSGAKEPLSKTSNAREQLFFKSKMSSSQPFRTSKELSQTDLLSRRNHFSLKSLNITKKISKSMSNEDQKGVEFENLSIFSFLKTEYKSGETSSSSHLDENEDVVHPLPHTSTSSPAQSLVQLPRSNRLSISKSDPDIDKAHFLHTSITQIYRYFFLDG